MKQLTCPLPWIPNPFGVRPSAFGGRCLGPSVRDRWTGAFNRARARDLEGEVRAIESELHDSAEN
jgi:hypothetical protein